jgi:uncharacterized protein YjbI with pentapeptide repeats
MVNQQTLEFIKQQLVDKWKLFRQEHPEEALDLTDADLGEMNLIRADLRGTNLSRADLGGVNLSGAYLGEANLSNANLGICRLELCRSEQS